MSENAIIVAMKTNVLYYGDNLDILRHHIPNDSIDLIYLDPPFNSQATYNVLFREESGAVSHAQIEAFEDTWHWGDATAQAYDEVIRGPHQQVARMLKAMVDGLGHNQVTAYLCMMAVRLLELHRILKSTGSLYLHCDPTAGPYLRVLTDSIFSPQMFRNEVIWRRTGSHNKARRFGPIHDTILFYTKTSAYQFNRVYKPYLKGHVDSYFRSSDERGRRYWGNALTGAGTRRGESGQPWRGINPTEHGRHWAVPGELIRELAIPEEWSVQQKLDALYERGLIHMAAEGSKAIPTYRQYLDTAPGMLLQDIWGYQPHTRGVLYNSTEGIDEDVRWLTRQGSKERLGYQTQKPLGVLERIISASSNPGDLVLDPFCGCGTAVHAAHKLGRKWIGVDITHLAIGLIRRRMIDAFPGLDIEVIGEPVDLTGAQELARKDKYQFQWWALDRLGAQPIAGKKKGSDKGIDGVIPFFAGSTAGKSEYARAIVSVKGGEHAGVAAIRDLKGVLDREKEPIGILLTLNPPTKDMTTEAAGSGFYESDFWKKKYPRLQILTVLDVLKGKRPDMPWGGSPFAKAPTEKERAEQESML